MVNLGAPYDPNKHEPVKPRELIPAGWYAMQAIESEVKKTKDGEGQLLELALEFIEAMHPELKGRRVWDRLNLWNKSQKAVDFANAKLSSICKAIGQIDQWTETDILHGRPLAVKLKVRAAKGDYEATNEPTDYDSIASRFQGGAPVSVSTMVPPPPGQIATPPAAPTVGGPQAQLQQAPSAPPPQGQPGEAAVPPWKQK